MASLRRKCHLCSVTFACYSTARSMTAARDVASVPPPGDMPAISVQPIESRLRLCDCIRFCPMLCAFNENQSKISIGESTCCHAEFELTQEFHLCQLYSRSPFFEWWACDLLRWLAVDSPTVNIQVHVQIRLPSAICPVQSFAMLLVCPVRVPTSVISTVDNLPIHALASCTCSPWSLSMFPNRLLLEKVDVRTPAYTEWRPATKYLCEFTYH